MFNSARQLESYSSSLENVMRERIINQVMVSWAILCTVAFSFTQLRAMDIGWTVRDYIHFACLCVIILLTIYRKKFHARHKAATLIVLSSGVAVAGIYSMGMLSGGIFFLPMATVIAALFYSKKTAIAFGLLLTATLSIIAVGISLGMIKMPPRITLLQGNLLHWTVYVCCFCIFLTFSCGTILSYRRWSPKNGQCVKL